MTNPGSPQWLARRRTLLLQMLSLGAALSGCGGGGGDAAPTTPTPPSPPPPSPPPASGPSGSLVYRNSGLVGVYNFATRAEIQFDPGTSPFVDPGVSVSRTGLISAALEGTASADFRLGFYGLNGQPASTYSVTRDLAFQTSAVVFNADGTRIAFSVDEPASANDTTRIARTLVADWPGGSIVAEIDRMDEPVWAGNELLLRDPATQRLRLYSSALVDLGLVGSIVVNTLAGGYSASADGRTLVYQDNSSGLRVMAYDRSNGSSWVAAEDNVSALRAPMLSPDGRHLALLTRGVFFDSPHVLPFAAGSTVTVDSAVHELTGGLVNCEGRIGWTA